jgi:hypothetical protein
MKKMLFSLFTIAALTVSTSVMAQDNASKEKGCPKEKKEQCDKKEKSCCKDKKETVCTKKKSTANDKKEKSCCDAKGKATAENKSCGKKD